MKKTFTFLLFILLGFNFLFAQKSNYSLKQVAPKIDGNLSEWASIAPTRLDSINKGATDSADLYAYFKTTWSPDSFYIMVYVTDNVAGTNFFNATNHDAIELYFDMNNSKIVWTEAAAGGTYNTLYDSDDNQIRIDRDLSGYAVTYANSKFPKSNAINMVKTSSETSWSIECAIAFKDLKGGEFMPMNGTMIGFDVMVGDNDDLGSGDGKKQSIYAWRDKTNNAWKNASLMGTLELAGAPNLILSKPIAFPSIIKVDGNLTDWNSIESVKLGKVNKGATDSSDLYAYVKTTSSIDSIYILVNVTDDIAGTNYFNATNHDAIELYFDMDNSKIIWTAEAAGGTYNTLYDANDNQIRIDRDIDGYVATYANTKFPATNAINMKKTSLATSWNVELAIAFKDLMPGFVAKNGTKIGFDVMVGDNDDLGTGDGKKQSIYAFNDGTNNAWKNASLMGELQIAGQPVFTGLKNIIVNAYPTGKKPMIDGKYNDWSFTDSLQIDRFNKGATTPDDLSASFKTSFDADSLYLLIKTMDNVKGTKFFNDFNHDNIEVYLDLNNSKGTTYDANDFLIRFDRDLTGFVMGAGTLAPNALNVKRFEKDTTGWGIEMSVAFKSLKSDFNMANDTIIGFDIMVGDNDDLGTGDGKKQSIIALNDATNSAWQKPSLFGVVKLKGTPQSSTVPVKGISLDKSTLSIVKGQTSKLVATINPSNSTNKGISWSSTNTAAATVDSEGMITAISAGTSKVIVTTTDGSFKDTCDVTVTFGTSLAGQLNSDNVIVSPNPAVGGVANVLINNSSEFKKVDLFNVNGLLIYTLYNEDGIENTKVDNLAKGVYILKVAGSNHTIIKRFIVE